MGEEEGFGGWQQWLRKGNQEFGFIHGMFEVPVRSSVMTSSIVERSLNHGIYISGLKI